MNKAGIPHPSPPLPGAYSHLHPPPPLSAANHSLIKPEQPVPSLHMLANMTTQQQQQQAQQQAAVVTHHGMTQQQVQQQVQGSGQGIPQQHTTIAHPPPGELVQAQMLQQQVMMQQQNMMVMPQQNSVGQLSPGGSPPMSPTSKDSLKSEDIGEVIDPNLSPEDQKKAKKAQRMQKNRVSAARSRQKKKEYIQELERKVYNLLQENKDLRNQLEMFNGTRNTASDVEHLKKTVTRFHIENDELRKQLHQQQQQQQQQQYGPLGTGTANITMVEKQKMPIGNTIPGMPQTQKGMTIPQQMSQQYAQMQHVQHGVPQHVQQVQHHPSMNMQHSQQTNVNS